MICSTCQSRRCICLMSQPRHLMLRTLVAASAILRVGSICTPCWQTKLDMTGGGRETLHLLGVHFFSPQGHFKAMKMSSPCGAHRHTTHPIETRGGKGFFPFLTISIASLRLIHRLSARSEVPGLSASSPPPPTLVAEAAIRCS